MYSSTSSEDAESDDAPIVRRNLRSKQKSFLRQSEDNKRDIKASLIKNILWTGRDLSRTVHSFNPQDSDCKANLSN